MGFNMDDYVDVPERLRLATEKWSDLRIQAETPKVVNIGDRIFIEVTVRAWRTPDDQIPAQATAWEPFPGQTPYTKNSEMMNAETSALGRCLALMGIGAKRSMASATDVRNRQAERNRDEHPANVRPKPAPQRPTKPQPGSAAFSEDDYVPPGEPAPVINIQQNKLTGATQSQKDTIGRLLEQTKMGLFDVTESALGRSVGIIDDLSKGDASAIIKALIAIKEEGK